MLSKRILVVDDDADILDALGDVLREEGYEILLAGSAAQAKELLYTTSPELVLLDIQMAAKDGISLLREWASSSALMDCPVIAMSGYGTVSMAAEATRLGAFDFLEKPLSLAPLLQAIRQALDAGQKKRERLRAFLWPPAAPIGRSPAMQSAREQAARIAQYDMPVLLLGEPGTGRSAFARYIHSLGPRSDQALVAVSAGGLGEDYPLQLHGKQTESGVEPGKFSEARGGSLLIEDLEDLLPEVQRQLLADLKSGSFTPVGTLKSRPLDIRLMTTAQPDFESDSAAGMFRKDLKAHLNVATVRVPPLREYAEDIPDLLGYFVDRLADDNGLPFRRFSIAAQNRLRNYSWPGNLKELHAFVQRLLMSNHSEEVTLAEVEAELSGQPAAPAALGMSLLAMPLREARQQFEREFLQNQLLFCKGDIDLLAKSIGMERSRAYGKLRSLGVSLSLREARQRFERAYLKRQLINCNGKVDQLAKRVGMERSHVYRKLHSLGVDLHKLSPE